MNREQLKKIDRFLTFGDIKPKIDETDCYYITDQAMQKVIDGFSKELLELHRIITMNQLIEVRKRAGQVEPEVKPANDVMKIVEELQLEYKQLLEERIANPTDDKENDIAVKNTYAGIISGVALLANRLSV